MEIVLASLAFAVAALCAGVMGFAIQRGATCTVAAVDEALGKRSFGRLLAILEASAWVAGGLLIARALGHLGTMPAGYRLSGWTVLGGALLGLGAVVNRACVFGSLARLGSGEWAYVATPLGFFVGALSFGPVFSEFVPRTLEGGSLILMAPGWVALPIAALMAWRIARPAFTRPDTPLAAMRMRWHREIGRLVWTPHAATTVIAIAFLILLLVAGAWSFTDALTELARGMAHSLPARTLLLLALIGGAVLGGWTAGRIGSTRPSPGQLLRCAAGGMIMAWGGLLTPGSNDALVLLGLPLLWPYAWVAFFAMCATIAASRAAEARWLKPRPAAGVAGPVARTATAVRGSRHGRT